MILTFGLNNGQNNYIYLKHKLIKTKYRSSHHSHSHTVSAIASLISSLVSSANGHWHRRNHLTHLNLWASLLAIFTIWTWSSLQCEFSFYLLKKYWLMPIMVRSCLSERCQPFFYITKAFTLNQTSFPSLRKSDEPYPQLCDSSYV